MVLKENKKRLVKNIEREVLTEDGEIKTTFEKHFVSEVKTDNFFMMFFENMAPFLKLKHASDIKLIACMSAKATFDKGDIHLTPKIRKELCAETGISYTNINKNLNRLKEVGLIIGEKSDYTINPSIFWKGTQKSRTEILKTSGMTFQIKIIEPSDYV